jgi:hypothetical protein
VPRGLDLPDEFNAVVRAGWRCDTRREVRETRPGREFRDEDASKNGAKGRIPDTRTETAGGAMSGG